jgi:hypothetical protein
MNPTREALQQHVLRLCERHDIVVHWCRRSDRAKAIYEFAEITIAPVRSLTSYATAMHEIGHILGRYQRSRRVMVREGWAWEWARANALLWTPAMERQAQESLAWCRRRAAALDRRWRPAEVQHV